jgi:Na+-transporting methylmalonyl-CoA/oxaloacetate decarboxylase gamma subunit
MSDNLSAALLISLLGMGIVFGIILLTWAIMAALTRIPPGKDEFGASDEAEEAEIGSAIEAEAAPASVAGAERAAVAAVAVALALAHNEQIVRVRPRNETAGAGTISAWQAIMRGRQLKQTYRRPRR